MHLNNTVYRRRGALMACALCALLQLCLGFYLLKSEIANQQDTSPHYAESLDKTKPPMKLALNSTPTKTVR